MDFTPEESAQIWKSLQDAKVLLHFGDSETVRKFLQIIAELLESEEDPRAATVLRETAHHVTCLLTGNLDQDTLDTHGRRAEPCIEAEHARQLANVRVRPMSYPASASAETMGVAEVDARFHRAMFRHGGLYLRDKEAQHLPDDAENKFHSACRHRLANDELPRVQSTYFNYILNWSVNACAFAENGSYCIGIFAGVPRNFFHAAYSILSRRDVLTHVGDPSLEGSPSMLGDDFSHGFCNPVVWDFSRLPQDPTRIWYAKLLAEIALEFLLEHEIAHISRGHLNYIADQGGISFLEEISAEKATDPAECLRRQAMELDADRRAVVCSLFRWSKVGVNYFADPEDAYRVWFLAVTLVFAILGERAADVDTEVSDTHPHPRVRWIFAVAAAHRLVTAKTRVSLNSIDNAWRKALIDAASLWAVLKVPGFRFFQPLSQARQWRVERLVSSLETQLQLLTTKLVPFAS